MTYLIDSETENDRAERGLEVLNQTEDNNDVGNATHSLELANDRARQILGLMWLKAVEAKDEETQAALIALDEQYTANSVTTANVILLLNAARDAMVKLRDQRDQARAELRMLEMDKDIMANEIASEMIDRFLTDPELFEQEQIEWLAEQIAESGLDYVKEQEQNRLDNMLEAAADSIDYDDMNHDNDEYAPDEAEIIEDFDSEDDAA